MYRATLKIRERRIAGTEGKKRLQTDMKFDKIRTLLEKNKTGDDYNTTS